VGEKRKKRARLLADKNTIDCAIISSGTYLLLYNLDMLQGTAAFSGRISLFCLENFLFAACKPK
jgi:hypothetical protein